MIKTKKVTMRDLAWLLLGVVLGALLGVMVITSVFVSVGETISKNLKVENVEISLNETLIVDRLYQNFREDFPNLNYSSQNLNSSGD